MWIPHLQGNTLGREIFAVEHFRGFVIQCITWILRNCFFVVRGNVVTYYHARDPLECYVYVLVLCIVIAVEFSRVRVIVYHESVYTSLIVVLYWSHCGHCVSCSIANPASYHKLLQVTMKISLLSNSPACVLNRTHSEQQDGGKQSISAATMSRNADWWWKIWQVW